MVMWSEPVSSALHQLSHLLVWNPDTKARSMMEVDVRLDRKNVPSCSVFKSMQLKNCSHVVNCLASEDSLVMDVFHRKPWQLQSPARRKGRPRAWRCCCKGSSFLAMVLAVGVWLLVAPCSFSLYMWIRRKGSVVPVISRIWRSGSRLRSGLFLYWSLVCWDT